MVSVEHLRSGGSLAPSDLAVPERVAPLAVGTPRPRARRSTRSARKPRAKGDAEPHPVEVAVRYVDGSVSRGTARDWAAMPGQGVDEVEVARRIAQGHSLYWLYQEGPCWVTGEASVGYSDQPLTEIVIFPDGSQRERRVEYMPDLLLEQIKLGWWRPGKSRPGVPGRA